MSRPQCAGCKAIIRWVRTRAGKAMPVDPERLAEWITETPPAGTEARRITLVTPDGALVTGYHGSVLTPGARAIEGYTPHWATCSKAKDFKRGRAPEVSDGE